MPHIYDKATGLCLVCDRAEIAAIREGKKFKRNNYDLRKTVINQLTDREDPNYRNIINRHYVRDNDNPNNNNNNINPKSKYFIDDDPDLILLNNPGNRNGKKSQQAIHPPPPPPNNSSSNHQPLQNSQQSNRQSKPTPPPTLPIPPPSNRSSRRSKPVITHYSLPQEYDPPDLYETSSRHAGSQMTPRPILKHQGSPSRLGTSSMFGPAGGDLVRSNGNLYYYSEDFGDYSPSPINYMPSHRDQPSRYYQYAADGSSPTHQVQYVTKAPKKTYFLPIDTYDAAGDEDDRVRYIVNNSPHNTRKKILVHHHYE